jgi:hypothetical protein
MKEFGKQFPFYSFRFILHPRFEEYETIVPASTSSSSSNRSAAAAALKIRSHSIIVRWNDAPIGHFLTHYDSKLSFEYTIDISPSPANELGLKSVLYKRVREKKKRKRKHGQDDL